MPTLANTPQAFIVALKALLSGMKTSMPAGLTQLTAGGKVSLLADLEAELQGILDVYQAAEDTAIAHARAVKDREDLAVTAVPRYAAIRAAVKAAFGQKSVELAKVGIQPNKTPPAPTVEQKKQRVAKAQATRVARGTKGKRQKQAIKGQPPPAPPVAPSAAPPKPQGP